MKPEKNEPEPSEKSPSIDLDSLLKKLVQQESMSLRLLKDLRYELSKEISRLIFRRESLLDSLAKPILGRYLELEGQNIYCLKGICFICLRTHQLLEGYMPQ